MIYLWYHKPVYGNYKFNIIKYEGPYLKVFHTQEEAKRFLSTTDIYIDSIDRI